MLSSLGHIIRGTDVGRALCLFHYWKIVVGWNQLTWAHLYEYHGFKAYSGFILLYAFFSIHPTFMRHFVCLCMSYTIVMGAKSRCSA
jgi:hypothetical protein